MKSNPLRTFFEWALITSVLMSVGFCVFYLVKSREVRGFDVEAVNAQAIDNNNRAFAGSLGGQCEAYAKTNQEFARFFASLAQGTQAPGSTPKPGTR